MSEMQKIAPVTLLAADGLHDTLLGVCKSIVYGELSV